MFNQYPYINLNDLNLDYILKAIKEMRYEVTNFVSINAIKYADPIQWNITSQYEKNTIVIDPVTGTAYISVAPVPAGVALTRTEYWTVVFDLGAFVTRAAQNFTSRWESDTTLTATFATPAGGWLVWGDVLYKALVNITAGDSYVVGSNIEHFTIEDLYVSITQAIADEVQARQDADDAINITIGDLDDLTTTDKTSIVNAINENTQAIVDEVRDRQDADDAINAAIGDLDDLVTTDKTNVVNAINENRGYIDNVNIANVLDYGAKGDGVTDDTNAIKDAIATGKTVYFPQGRYLISDTLIIADNQLFMGVDKYDSIIISNMTDKPFVSGAITDINSADTTPLRRASIKNLGFEMVHATRTAPILLFMNPVFCELDHVYVINGISANDAESRVVFKAVNYNVEPAWENRIHDCHFHMAKLYLYYSSDCYIYDNYFNNVALDYSIKLQNSSGTMVENNQIIGELDIVNTQFLIITGNYFDGGGANNPLYLFHGIEGTYEIANIVISSNRFYHMPKRGISIETGFNLLTISDNIFEDCDWFNGGFDDIVLTKTGNYDGASTCSNNKHRHLYCYSGGATIARSASTNNGKAYSITNYTSGMITVSNAMMFNSAWYDVSTLSGAAMFITCFPPQKFPNGRRGTAQVDAGRKTLAFDFSGGDTATAHVDYNMPFSATPITFAQLHGSTLHNAFIMNTTSADATGFDVICTRDPALAPNTSYTLNVNWSAISP